MALDQTFPMCAASTSAFRMGFDEAIRGLACSTDHTNGWLMNSYLVGYSTGYRQRLFLDGEARRAAPNIFYPSDAEWGE